MKSKKKNGYILNADLEQLGKRMIASLDERNKIVGGDCFGPYFVLAVGENDPKAEVLVSLIASKVGLKASEYHYSVLLIDGIVCEDHSESVVLPADDMTEAALTKLLRDIWTGLGETAGEESGEKVSTPIKPIVLTLMSLDQSETLVLPASAEELERAKRELEIEDFADAVIAGVDYGAARLNWRIPMNGISVEAANEMARYLQYLKRDEELMQYSTDLKEKGISTFNEALEYLKRFTQLNGLEQEKTRKMKTINCTFTMSGTYILKEKSVYAAWQKARGNLPLPQDREYLSDSLVVDDLAECMLANGWDDDEVNALSRFTPETLTTEIDRRRKAGIEKDDEWEFTTTRLKEFLLDYYGVDYDEIQKAGADISSTEEGHTFAGDPVFAYLKEYVASTCFDEEGSIKGLHTLWVAFCLHRNLTANMCDYTAALNELWNTMGERDDNERSHWGDFSEFVYNMSQNLR